MNTEAQRHSAYTLNNEIFIASRDTQLAHRILDAIFEHRLEESELDTADYTSMRISYDEISWRLEILMDYVFKTRNRLEALERLASSFLSMFSATNSMNNTVDRSSSTPPLEADEHTKDARTAANDGLSIDQSDVNKLINLLTDAAQTGRVNSKALLEVMQTTKKVG